MFDPPINLNLQFHHHYMILHSVGNAFWRRTSASPAFILNFGVPGIGIEFVILYALYPGNDCS
jgi:hypothetical protein